MNIHFTGGDVASIATVALHINTAIFRATWVNRKHILQVEEPIYDVLMGHSIKIV